jgi:hypothetical protein
MLFIDEIALSPDDYVPHDFVRCLGCGGLFPPIRIGQKRCGEDCGRTTDRHKNRNAADRPFIGIDGEGGGVNAYGQQNYLLLCASGITPETQYPPLFKDNRPLRTTECLEYLLSLPANAKYVIFGLGYYITQILRDVPEVYIKQILEGGYDAPTYWKNYGLKYVPGKFFSVALIDDRNKITKGSTRIIEEVRGFFQKPFAEVVRTWLPEETSIDMIEKMKGSGQSSQPSNRLTSIILWKSAACLRQQ